MTTLTQVAIPNHYNGRVVVAHTRDKDTSVCLVYSILRLSSKEPVQTAQ